MDYSTRAVQLLFLPNIRLLQQQLMTNCQICRKDIKQQKYSCCKQTKFYCRQCRLDLCKTCWSIPRACMKQKVQTFNRQLLSCSLCKIKIFQTLSQYLHQPKCKYDFCYECLIPLYENYFKQLEQIQVQQGIRPQFPFQLPCRCELSQKEILNFLQKSCYQCKMKIGSQQTYRLNNNLRLMKSCYNKPRQHFKYRLNSIQNQRFERLKKMILKCQGCDRPLDSLLSNEQNLNVCRNCVQLNKLQVKILEKEKQEQRSEQKPKMVKKQIEDIEIEVKQVKLEKVQEKIQKIGSKGTKNELKIQKEQQINLSEKIDQPEKQQPKKQYKNQKNQKKDNIVNVVVKVMQQPDRSFLEEVVEPKTMHLSQQIFHNLIQCKQCFVVLAEQDSIIKPLQDVGSSAVKAYSKQKQSKQKQNVVQKQSICKLCYLSLKSKQKLIENQRKMLQKMQKTRLYKSTQKTQKKVENNTNNIFSKFDNYYDPNIYTKKTQPQKPNTDTKPSLLTTTSYVSTSNNLLLQKCSKCNKRVYSSHLNKRTLQCRDCESEALQKQNKIKVQKMVDIICRRCKKLKKLKQSEVGKIGYCKQCSELILGR